MKSGYMSMSRSLTIDVVIIKADKLVLIKRKHEPFKYRWALPGGYVDSKETIKQAVIREAKEETNLQVKPIKIIGIYDNPERDPRGTISVAWLCKPIKGKLKAKSDALAVKFFNLNKLPDLAFDHEKIIKDCTKLKQKKVLVGGCFNVLHAGHCYFLKKAKTLGDFLVVILANDKTVLKSKKKLIFPAQARKLILESLKWVDKVRIGYAMDKLKVVEEEKPDIIALGYDQKIDEKKLKLQLKLRGLKCKVIRIKTKLKGYSTGKIMKSME